MEMLSPMQVQAGDEILKECDSNGTASPFRLFGRSTDNNWGWEIDDITNAGDFLMGVNVIKRVSDRVKESGVEYMFTAEGELSYQKGMRTVDYVNEEAQKEAEQQRKEERDEHYKNLQVRDLEEKLNIMNVEQRDFWATQKAKNKQTTLIAIISALFSLVALLKTWGFFD